MMETARVTSDAVLTVGLGQVRGTALRLKPARAALLEDELDPEDDEDILDPIGEPEFEGADDSD